MKKKQIVFIEAKPTVYTFKIARTLKLTGRYKTVLICFSDVDKELFGNAFDEFHILEWSHKINFGNFIDFFRKIFGKEGKVFFKKLSKMKPYIFQVTGPDLFTLISMFFLKKSPKIYFAYDIWGIDKRNFLFTKNPGIKGCFQRFIERICFKMAEGVLHKGQPGELKLLKYNVNLPDLSFVPGCLDEVICPIKRKKLGKEIHIVYAGGPLAMWRSSFMDVVRIITSQKIHIHTYGPCIDKKDKEKFVKEYKKNKYFHFHKKEAFDKLNQKLSIGDFGIQPDFQSPEKVNTSTSKTEMSNRLFNYIESGLPIITNKKLEFMSEIVEDNEIGISINFEDLKNLKEIIMKRDYKKMKENVKKAQDKFRLSKIIKDLEKFYDVIVNKKINESQ